MANSTVNTTINSISVSSDGSVYEEDTSGLRDLLENLRLSGMCLSKLNTSVLITYRHAQWNHHLEVQNC